MENPCDCCTGTRVATPALTANRPGLNALAYRVGTHATFLETMKARLSNLAMEIPALDESVQPEANKIYPLHDLTTRDASDPAIALLDAWATVADVLTFYQERIANEGYLGTATERRSILELARLVGYKLRPGVASSIYLAYTLDDQSKPVEIAAGARAQSIPGPGELPQSFETFEPVNARKEWNDLKPRMMRPQSITKANAEFISAIYFEGTETNLKPNDPLLLVFEGEKEGESEVPVLRKIKTVETQFADKRTKVTLQLSFTHEVFRKAIGQVVERYLKETSCVDALDHVVARTLDVLKVLEEATVPNSPVPIDLPKLVFENLEKLRDLNIDADKSGNARAQKWISNLMDELLKNLRGLQVDVAKPTLVTSGPLVTGEGPSNVSIATRTEFTPKAAFANLANLARPLSLRESLQPSTSLRLQRDEKHIFDTGQDTIPQLFAALNQNIGTSAYQAWANATVTGPSTVKIYALRVTASLFGSAAPRRVLEIDRRKGKILKTGEYPIVEMIGPPEEPVGSVKHEVENSIQLDSSYDKILPDTWVVIDMSGVERDKLQNMRVTDVLITRTNKVVPSVSVAKYGISGKTTNLKLNDGWFKFKDEAHLVESPDDEFQLIRQTVVHTQSEQLVLAQEPVSEDVCGGRIELGALYDGLYSGRRLIVSGERTDISNTRGVNASEPVILAGVEQSYDKTLPGDKIHSTLILANKLAYTYKRDSINIYGNVVKATHGETRNEVLGGGDATKPLQQFTLKQPPLTYVSAPTIEGVASTLEVRVNDVQWHETDSLAGLSHQDRKFIARTDDDGKTSIVFGNGREGARLPTGVENVKATYRNGIGRVGNVIAEQVSLLMTRPLGVKAVINPLRASGGADKESRDQARRNAPLAVTALDRLVSTQDYADFARTFAGIGKASATRLTDGHRQLVHLTIAGVDDIPIDEHSDLYRNLRQSLHQFGDPYQAIQIDVRELMAIVISARVRVLPDYQWETVEPKIRAGLLSRFSFEQRELGQPVILSEVMSTIQLVAGVAYVDVDVLDSVSESEVIDPTALKKKFDNPETDDTPSVLPVDATKENPTEQPRKYIRVGLAQTAAQNKARAALMPSKSILPAQLAFLLPAVPATLNLNVIKEVNR